MTRRNLFGKLAALLSGGVAWAYKGELPPRQEEAPNLLGRAELNRRLQLLQMYQQGLPIDPWTIDEVYSLNGRTPEEWFERGWYPHPDCSNSLFHRWQEWKFHKAELQLREDLKELNRKQSAALTP